jgi:hypothetical protein
MNSRRACGAAPAHTHASLYHEPGVLPQVWIQREIEYDKVRLGRAHSEKESPI